MKVLVNYPKNKKVCGIFSGRVIETGRFRTGYAYFRLDTCPELALPNSSKYVRRL